MKPSRIRPASYVKANAAEQETLALLKILALGNRQIAECRTVRADEALRRLRGKTRVR